MGYLRDTAQGIFGSFRIVTGTTIYMERDSSIHQEVSADRKYGKTISDGSIIIVSGLPRSGTSLMMNMLEKGGLAILTDGIRTPDEDNPNGYFEYEPVKQLGQGQTDWLYLARGKAVKVISALLPKLPPEYNYHLIFMTRSISEVVASQKLMLVRRGEDPDKLSYTEATTLLKRHLDLNFDWINNQPNINLIKIDYSDLILRPESNIETIMRTTGIRLDSTTMISVIDPDLYRNKK